MYYQSTDSVASATDVMQRKLNFTNKKYQSITQNARRYCHRYAMFHVHGLLKTRFT